MENVNAPFLSMVENLSIAVSTRGTDLMKPRFNHLSKRGGFKFNDDPSKDEYELFHQMSDYIEVCRHATIRLLIVRMGYVKRHIYLTKISNHELDKKIDSVMMAGPTDDNKLKDVMIMGTIVHTLFQSILEMVATGLCTETQYEAVCSDLLDIMAC